MKKLSLLFFSLAPILISCEHSQEISGPPEAPVEQIPRKMFAGQPDLPENDFHITSAGIGKIILGHSLEQIHFLYDSIQTQTIYKEGGEWTAKKIFLGGDQWIFAESVNSVDQITGIYTNSSRFKTAQGYSIGSHLDSMVLRGDSLHADFNRKAFLLYDSGVWFKTDPRSEKLFFGSKAPGLTRIGNAKIEEFFIICGDC